MNNQSLFSIGQKVKLKQSFIDGWVSSQIIKKEWADAVFIILSYSDNIAIVHNEGYNKHLHFLIEKIEPCDEYIII